MRDHDPDFPAWSRRWLELASFTGAAPDDVEGRIALVLELWRLPIPGVWKRGADAQLLGPRYRRGDAASPHAGEHAIEAALLASPLAGARCLGAAVIDAVNAIPLARDGGGGRAGNVEADLLLLLRRDGAERIAVAEVKEGSGDAWYAAVENLRQLRLLSESEAAQRLFHERGSAGGEPGGLPLQGLVIAPARFYGAPGRKSAAAAAAQRLLARVRSELGQDVRLALWQPGRRAVEPLEPAAPTPPRRRVDARGRAYRGSQLQVQLYCARRPDRLTAAVLDALPELRARARGIAWVAPREEEGFGEPRDDAFLAAVGLPHLAGALRAFWPARGPTWDALGVAQLAGGDRGVVLVEAKAHPAEIHDGGCRAGAHSRAQIARALAETQRWLGVELPVEAWLDPAGEPPRAVYQAANRYAMLYWLRRRQRVPAWLVKLYIVDDPSYRPTGRVAWQAALGGLHARLGVATVPHAADVFLPGRERAELACGDGR